MSLKHHRVVHLKGVCVSLELKEKSMNLCVAPVL